MNSKAKQLIAQNKTQILIDELLRHFYENKDDLTIDCNKAFDQLILLSSQQIALKEGINLMSSQDKRIQEAQINWSLLQIINNLNCDNCDNCDHSKDLFSEAGQELQETCDNYDNDTKEFLISWFANHCML